MGRFRVISTTLRSARVIVCAVLIFTPRLQSQKSASLRGTIRDPQGKPAAGAIVKLQSLDAAQSQPQTVHADVQGSYSFSAIRGGLYVLRAGVSGYGDAEISSLFVSPGEVKKIDLILSPAGKPEFFDPPQFVVSGVTDTTSLGGHGSDTIVRNREGVAKETASLSNLPATPLPLSESEKSLRDSVEREPHSFSLNHRLGKLLLESGKPREAIPFLERAAELASPGAQPEADENTYENSYDLALANTRAGNYERARDGARTLLTQYDTAELHHLLADANEKLGNSLDAVHEYERAVELKPLEGYFFDWGSELLLHHAPEPAVEVFLKGNRLFPRSTRMLIGLSAAYFAQGANDQVVQRISEASDLNPNDPIPYSFMGKMEATELGPSADIAERLHRFLVLQPDNPEANYYYAIVLGKLRNGPLDSATAQVESLLRNAIRLDPKFAAAYLRLGILHSEQRNYALAVSDYQHAIQFDSQKQLDEAHYRLAQAYRQMGNPAQAAAELQIYDQITRESAKQAERERHEIRQFIYRLRDQAPAAP